MSRNASLAGPLCLCFLPTLVSATIHTVRKDGTGDFLTIRDAVEAAAAGDTVEVGPGTYGDTVSVDVALTVVSTDGVGSTIVEGAPAWRVTAGPSRIEGFNFRDMGPPGRALRIDGAQATISDCVFYSNRAPEHPVPGSPDTYIEPGGGAYVENGAVVDFIRCRFDDNFASDGAAAFVTAGAYVTLNRCEVVNNTGWDHCTGVTVQNAALDVIDCLFAGNFSKDSYARSYPGSGPGALKYVSSTGSVTGSTFYENKPGDIEMRASATVPVERCIFSGSRAGIAYYYEPGPRSCNIYWGNALLWRDEFEPDELVINPLFCDPEADDFSISTTSAAAPEHSPCGQLIGAFAPQCTLDTDPFLITVRKDGSGDHTSIGSAIREAYADGITVEVGPAIYSNQESLGYEINHAISVRSTHGADATIIDGDRKPLFSVTAPAGKTVEIEGLTLRNAAKVNPTDNKLIPGPALNVKSGHVEVTNCVLEESEASSGGAVYAFGSGSSILFSNCEFINNRVVNLLGKPRGRGGAAYAQNGASITARGCRFSGNTGRAAALAADWATLEVDSCLFVDNRADAGADSTSQIDGRYGTLSFDGALGHVTRSTFYANRSLVFRSETSAGTILAMGSPGVVIERNIFAGDINGAGVHYITGPGGPRSCNVYWDNGGGAVAGDTLTVDELDADPQFCDPVSGDFTLSEGSPAAPNSGVCALQAGAFPVGCNPVPANVAFRTSPQTGGIDLTWQISSGVTVAGCWAQRECVADGQTARLPETGLLDHTAGGFFDSTSMLGQSYHYTLFVVDDQNNEYPSYTTTATDGYMRIERFKAVALLYGIDLGWEASASEPMAGYYVVRELSSGGGQIKIPASGLIPPDSTSLVDEDVSMGQEYEYTLVAVDGRGTEHPSQPIVVTSLPFRVDNFRAESVLDVVELQWQASTIVNPLHCYLLREDLTRGGTDRVPTDGYFDGNEELYIDDGVEPEHRYQYVLYVELSPAETYLVGSGETVTGYLSVGEFLAAEKPGGVELTWDVAASDSLLGCYLNRYDRVQDVTKRMPEQGLLESDAGGYFDGQALQGRAYQYTLVVVDWQQGEHPSATAELTTTVYRNRLDQNQPNPFNPTTTIPYTIEEKLHVTLTVFDVMGRCVRTLVDRTQPAGQYTESWDGTIDLGGPVASGIYLYRLRAGVFEETRKMTLVR